ncbi:protein kinase 1, putative (PK1) [Elysia marginata]|uniref:Protein kinase 1, putative (PK1) n=1 Tax=Elysia marginata TaxID=1093978 RepID=A0AAV4EDD7_9GAST|nr:protein kinase 1, putative (PK1) [Elysia marginata]
MTRGLDEMAQGSGEMAREHDGMAQGPDGILRGSDRMARGFDEIARAHDEMARGLNEITRAHDEMALGSGGAIARQQIRDLLGLIGFSGHGHVTSLPQEFMYIRLSEASIWLETVDNYIHATNATIHTSVFTALLDQARRVLLTSLLDPITWHAIHHSRLLFGTAGHPVFLDINCATSMDNLLSTGKRKYFCTPALEKPPGPRGLHGWTGDTDDFHSGQLCNGVNNFYFDLHSAAALLRTLHALLLRNTPLVNATGQGLCPKQCAPIQLILSLKNSLKNTTALLLATMESSSLHMRYRNLFYAYSNIVVYIWAMCLAVPTFLTLTQYVCWDFGDDY